MENSGSQEVMCQSEGADEVKLQKTLLYNKFLPYYSSLRPEADQLLLDIKVNLSHAVQRHEIWPGALYWTNRLQSFLKLYGFHFSKTDHTHFIHLLFELVTTSQLESSFLYSWAILLTHLLKKPKTLSRSDLVLPWRPLYQLAQSVYKSKFVDLGMNIYSPRACTAVKHLVVAAKIYFPLESTQEMLDEWRPLLCYIDMSMVDIMSYICYFLPTLLPPEHHHRGFKLWFEEFMTLWCNLHSPTAEEYFIKLFVRLATHNVGHIDWTPHLPQLFSRVLKSFQLPVGPSQLRLAQTKQYIEAHLSANLIVSMLGGRSKAQEYLNRLMLSLESFYHPSNHGRETKKLLAFLKELSIKFIVRLKYERFKEKRWYNITTKEAELTEQDIDEFVQCLLPSLRMAIFSKFGTMDAAVTLHNLALIRPELILPDLLEKTYTALETLTEPHQVIATLQCMTAVSRTLLSGGHGRYPEGKKHLFSLLTHVLPGIDSNDYRKTLVSGLLISALIAMVPLVDCSASINNKNFNMTKEEEELCSLTAQFEDFVLVYLDRCFALVGNTRLEQAAALDRQVSSSLGGNNHETIMGAGISGSVHTILVQASPHIFKVASDKIYHYATSQIFESEVAGRLCADMCASVSKANPEEGLKLFVPYCVREINQILEDPYQMDAEHPDHALIWNLQLLSQVLYNVGSALLPYADELLHCLRQGVNLKSKQASQHAATAITNILQSLTMMYPLNLCSIAGGFSQSPEEHLYIRDWSLVMDGDCLGVRWHMPSDEDLKMVDRVLDEFLRPKIESLRAFMAGEGEEWDREKLNQVLKLFLQFVFGAAKYLPMWDGPQVEGCPTSSVSQERKDYVTYKLERSPNEMYFRKKLVLFLHQLTDHIMRTREDDTKSMLILVQIIKVLMCSWGISTNELEARWHAYKYSKGVISDKLRGRQNDVRPLFVIRVQLQHDLRMTEKSMSVQTELHHLMFQDILKMSVSHYAHVRVKAQSALSRMLDIYLYSGRKLLPHVLPLLNADEEISHEQFKGALHVLLIPTMANTYTHQWSMMRETLPIIIKAGHSEKPSIQVLMIKLAIDVKNRYGYFSLEFKVSEGSVSAAAALHEPISESMRMEGKATNDSFTKDSIMNYEGVVGELVNLIEAGQLQWRYSQTAISFLLMLVRHDHPLPVPGIQLLVRCLVHNVLVVRKMAVSAVIFLLQQQKRKFKRVPVDVPKEAGVDKISPNLPPGEKEENAWLCYDPDRLPVTEKEWEEFIFIDKTHWGYYTYPKELMTYAPYKDQPSLSRCASELSLAERVVYDAFSSADFVEKLVSFLSLEENNGKDRFDRQKFTLFKYLFRNFGTSFLPMFMPHIEKLSLDTQHESHQRFAAEIISGIVSGSKHWNHAMVQEMRRFLEPLLVKVMDALTPETRSDWSTCMNWISANRDPRRISWLLQLLMKNQLNGENGSFKDASRLYMLQSLLAQQEWRVGVLHHQVVNYLRTRLDHSYKIVRERIGSLLSQIFLYDKPGTVKFNPKKAELIEEVLQKMPTLDQVSSLTEDVSTLKLCKTCLVWIITTFQYDAEMFRMIPELLPLVTVENDDEVGILVKSVCARVAHASLGDETVPKAISSLEKAIECGLWKVRVIAIQVLQVLLFENLFLCVPYQEIVKNLLISLCENPQMEVREIAASSIGGLIRCGYIDSIHRLKAHFIRQSHCKLPKKLKLKSPGASLQDNGYEGALTRRHSGVLGLAALVEACPYSVPEWLPDVLDEMALHLHDPAPIEGTVKKAMSEFKRTHHDSWSEHKLKFTDDQLAILTDLLISPSYYA